jgi:hypothetical protein
MQQYLEPDFWLSPYMADSSDMNLKGEQFRCRKFSPKAAALRNFVIWNAYDTMKGDSMSQFMLPVT